MDQIIEERRDAAFQLLEVIVRERHDAGRRTLAAMLKPAIKARTAGGFDEKELGYVSGFREFLRAAHDRGLVDLHPAPTGPDLEVVPSGRPTLPPAPPSGSRSAVGHGRDRAPHVRRDLWQAFTDWREGWIRLFDREAKVAVMLPQEPSPLERPEFTEARRGWQADPSRYVEIEPFGLETQLSWMREFADAKAHDQSVATLLGFALAHELPVREFTRALRNYPELNREWNLLRANKVVSAIADWMARRGLEAPVLSAPPQRSVVTVEPGTLAISRSEIRHRLHEAIDRMPEGELLRISIPIEYLFTH